MSVLDHVPMVMTNNKPLKLTLQAKDQVTQKNAETKETHAE